MTQGKEKRLVENGDGTWTLSLTYPITRTLRDSNGVETQQGINELTFRRIKGGDIRALANVTKQGDQFATLFVRLTGITMPDFDKLDAVDLLEVGDLFDDFLPEHLKTGAAT